MADRLSDLRRGLRAQLSARPAWWRRYRTLRRRLLGEAPPPGPIHQLLEVFARERRDVVFVQVGSNDANFGDPIIDFVLAHGWRGVLVEPVPDVYRRLRRAHGANPRLTLENLAIGEREGPRPFYRMEPLDQPLSPWYDQLGSFSREHIEKHERFTPGLSAHIREIQVDCVSLTTLLRRHGLSALDLLHVDAEGADFEVLRSLDFDYCAPDILLFEHGHLPRAEQAACGEFLVRHGYRWLYEGRDCLALKLAAHARLPATARLFDALAPDF
jgi:FkbM family methyltransferase